MARTRVLGVKALEAKLRRIPDEARSAIRQTLAQSADEIVDAMKALAPVGPPSGTQKKKRLGAREGDLRDSIVATFGGGEAPKYAAFQRRNKRTGRPIAAKDPDLSVTISAGNSGVRYAHFVEFGTAPHINGGKFAGTQHPGARAQPFFYPVYRAYKRRVKSRISRAISRSAKAVAASKGKKN